MSGLIPSDNTSALPPLAALKQVLDRQKKLVVRDPSLVKARIGQCVVIGLVIGSLFYGLKPNLEDARTFFGAIFMAVMFMGFGGMPQLAVTLQNRSIWFKQRQCNMYSATSYAWSMTIVQFPLSLIESLVFAVLIYFLVGFSTDGPEYFFIFYVVLALSSLSITSLFRMVGCLFHDMAIANAVAGFTLLMLVVNSGYIIVRNSIPPWVIYFYWVSPFAFAMRALAINEMTSPRWDERLPNGKTTGQAALDQFDFFDDRVWIWLAMGYLAFFLVLTTSLSALGLAWLSPPVRKVVMHTKEELKASRMAARKAKLAAQAFLAAHPNQHRHTRESMEAVRIPEAGIKSKDQLSSVTNNAIFQAVPSALDPDGDSMSRSRITVSANGLAVARTLAFTPISVVWKDLRYYVSVPKGLMGPAAANVMGEDCGSKELVGKKRLLNGITGYARPGVLTALMGGSGAGKTTLMDILAGRKTQGIITGDLLVNGHPKEQHTWARVVGYVEQTDVHSAGLTVEESLALSAGLRLSAEVSPEIRSAYVDEVLTVTELLDIRGNMVGSPGLWGLSVEQRRRLSIGVEIVANPSVVFMDEPTSGLDARAAAAVMAAVRNVAANGRTVMVTIHQPSIEIFEQFDALVLLGMGGAPIFFGKLGQQSSLLVSYFEAIPGVPKLPPNYNPATWMLEVCGGAAKMHVDSLDADFHQLYLASDNAARAATTADRIVEAEKQTHGPLTQSSPYAAGRYQQIKVLIWKYSLIYWRDPGYSLGRLFASTVTALIFGLTFYGAGKLPTDRPIELSDLQDILGSVYSGLSFNGMTNLIMGIPAFTAERQVSYRERASSMYAVLPLGIATGLVEIPYLVLQGIIFTGIVYFMIGFKGTFEAVAYYFIIFSLSISLYTFMGQLFTYLMPTPALATVLGGLNHFLWNIFNGFLVPNPLMPKGWLWMNYISATTWVIYGLGASQLGDIDRKVVVPGYLGCNSSNLDTCPTVSEWIEDYFGYKYKFRWWCAVILLAFVLLFRVSAMIVLKVVNHQKR